MQAEVSIAHLSGKMPGNSQTGWPEGTGAGPEDDAEGPP